MVAIWRVLAPGGMITLFGGKVAPYWICGPFPVILVRVSGGRLRRVYCRPFTWRRANGCHPDHYGDANKMVLPKIFAPQV